MHMRSQSVIIIFLDLTNTKCATSMNHDFLLSIKTKAQYKTFSLPRLHNFQSTG